MAESITRKNVDLDILDYYDGKIKNYVDNKVGTGSLTIDDTLSETSTNPVQNKVVKQAIDNKADKSLYGDTTINVGRKSDTDVGIYSTAEGYQTTASGSGSYAGGYQSTASGICSHAEGYQTTASGDHSHTYGLNTKALHDGEVAYGKYNVSNDNTLFSIGDGTADDARHNAFEITTTGGKLHDKDIATTDLIPTSLPANGGNADTLDNKHASDFANSYNDDLMKFLNGQSGDIRTLVQQLPLGGYVFNTTQSELSGITFPIYGDGIMLWGGCKYSANDLRYGILIIRPMLSTGYTYICSVYNNSAHTDWEEISTTPIKSAHFAASTINGYIWTGIAFPKYIVGVDLGHFDVIAQFYKGNHVDAGRAEWTMMLFSKDDVTTPLNGSFNGVIYYID